MLLFLIHVGMAASKRSKLQPSWADVVYNLRLEEKFKPEVTNTLAKFGTTVEFLHQNENVKLLICETARIEDFEEDVVDTIASMIEELPSPSHMRYEHVGLILDGKVSSVNNAGELKECVLSSKEREFLIDMYSAVDRSCSNDDVSTRVVTLVITLAKHMKIEFSTQPMENQTANIGYSIDISSLFGTALIEIKKSATYCDLLLEVDDTAQALRQAHLTMEKRQGLSCLLLVTTNSRGWSFGLVKRKRNKIKVTSTVHFDIHNEEEIVHIYAMLKSHFLCRV